MKNYFAGYYLIKINKANFGSILGRQIHTCSTCINDSLLDNWSYSWAIKEAEKIEEAEKSLSIPAEKQKKVQNWLGKKEEEKKIGWKNVFSDLGIAR